MSAAPPPKPVAGVPPSLEWVAVDRLSIDPSYQRGVEDPASEKLIGQIAQRFDWALCQPLSCCRRPDGSIVVVDGQHRLLGARTRGDIPHLPCIISPSQDVSTEAALFTALNRRRKALSRFDIWRAAVAAGQPEAIEAKQLIESAGLSVPKSTNTSSWKPGDFGGIAAVVRSVEKHGSRPVQNALIALGEAFADEPITSGASLMHALVRIYARPPEGFDPDAMIEALGSRMQDEWVDEARAQARSQLRDGSTILTENLLRGHDRAVRSARAAA